jgi:hypothetical protein
VFSLLAFLECWVAFWFLVVLAPSSQFQPKSQIAETWVPEMENCGYLSLAQLSRHVSCLACVQWCGENHLLSPSLPPSARPRIWHLSVGCILSKFFPVLPSAFTPLSTSQDCPQTEWLLPNWGRDSHSCQKTQQSELYDLMVGVMVTIVGRTRRQSCWFLSWQSPTVPYPCF